MCVIRGRAGAVLAVLCWGLLAAAQAISVLRLPVAFEQEQTVTVDNTVEYILEFMPNGEQAQWPALVSLRASGGDLARPVLLTARQTTGAQTWQLPYQAAEDSEPLYELQRTLCFRAAQNGGSTTEPFSLHVSSASNASVQVAALVQPARDWLLQYGTDSTVHITQTAPRVYFYRFAAEEERIRLVVASEDDTCATVSVQNYTCPVAETVETVMQANGYYMTVQRSGGVQVSRSQFPNGFYVVSVVRSSDEACVGERGEGAAHSDWLFDAAVGRGDVTGTTPAPLKREKTLTLGLRAALTRGQYAAACAATLALFLSFYVAFLALVWAQRFPSVKRAVGPKAVLARQDANANEEGLSPTERRRRRGSDATFDSADDDSESDEDPTPQPTNTTNAAASDSAGANIAYTSDNTLATPRNGAAPSPATAVNNISNTTEGTDTTAPSVSPQERSNGNTEGVNSRAVGEAPFGLPTQLRLAALSKHKARTLGARSDRYLTTLYTVAVFYALPVVQFVIAFQVILNVSGSLDLCYYNFLCAHPVGRLSDFNHVFSNLGYLLLGALLMLQVRRRRERRRRKPRDEEYGIPAHYGLVSSLGAGMMVVALLSASYHVCPNQLNFQFDTAFMYVLAVLAMVKLYQARHPDINARAHATFGVLAVLIALVVWGVLGGGALFWGLWTVLHVFTILLLSLRIYYVGQFRLEPAAVAEAARSLRGSPPLYASRLLALWIGNAVNWAFAIYGLWSMSADFASHLLFVLLGNTLLYMVFYLAMKLVHGERLRWYAWCYLAGAAATWAPAMYYFVSGSSSWSATPAHSRHLNHECRVLAFYDSHDLWHLLSAVALYLSFGALLCWDDGLSAVKRTDIAVF